MGLDPDEIKRMKDEDEIEEEENNDDIVTLEEREYNEEKVEVRLTKKKCTNMKTNRRVYMPPARPVKEECVLQTRENAWMEEWRRYRGEECGKEGSQQHHQLTREECLGKASLLKRVSKGEIHISPSNKGKGLVVMSTDLYHDMSVVHTLGDKKVDWRELEDSQREVRAHARALSRMVNLGEAGGVRKLLLT